MLSIVIINWNTLGMLRDCLASVLSNLGTLDAETIVVDNASSDGSADMVAEEFPEVVLIRNTDNVGFAAANNQAMKIAKGDYVLLLNSDTLVHGDVLEKSKAYMDAHPELGIMGCRVHNADGSLQPTCSRFPTLLNLVLLTSGLWKLPWPAFFDRYQMRRWKREDERDVEVVAGCYMFARAEAISQVGMLDESFFFFGEETDWCRRFQLKGWGLRFAPVGVISHFGGGSSGSLNYKRDLMLTSATVRLHRKHYGMASAITAWLILSTFNVSRALYWSLRGLVSNDKAVLARREHFVTLARNLGRAWPSERSYAGE